MRGQQQYSLPSTCSSIQVRRPPCRCDKDGMALAPGTRGDTKAIVAVQMLVQIGALAHEARCKRGWPARPTGSTLPDVPGQKKGGDGAGQTGESAGAEAQRPGAELRRPAELIERDAEQKCP